MRCELIIALHGDIVQAEWLHVGVASRLLGRSLALLLKLVVDVVLFHSHGLHLVFYLLNQIAGGRRGRHALLKGLNEEVQVCQVVRLLRVELLLSEGRSLLVRGGPACFAVAARSAARLRALLAGSLRTVGDGLLLVLGRLGARALVLAQVHEGAVVVAATVGTRRIHSLD